MRMNGLERMINEHDDVQRELAVLAHAYAPIYREKKRRAANGLPTREQRDQIAAIEERGRHIARTRGWDVPCFVASIDAKALNS